MAYRKPGSSFANPWYSWTLRDCRASRHNRVKWVLFSPKRQATGSSPAGGAKRGKKRCFLPLFYLLAAHLHFSALCTKYRISANRTRTIFSHPLIKSGVLLIWHLCLCCIQSRKDTPGTASGGVLFLGGATYHFSAPISMKPELWPVLESFSVAR